jgi:hypothetical protein
MDADKNTCAMPTCTCRVSDGHKFCSAFCEGQGETPEVFCSCGHPECGSQRPLTPADESQRVVRKR